MEKYRLDIIDLYKNRKYYVFILVEKVLIIFLLYIIMFDSAKIFIGIYNIKEIDGMSVYVNSDSTSDEKINQLFNNNKSINKANELNDYINDNFINYSYWEYENFEQYNGHSTFQASTNIYFFELYGLNVIEGRNFVKEDELKNDNIKSVIVGYGLRNKYKLGQQYEEIDLNTGERFNFKVIGVLKKGAYYPSLTLTGKKNNLDYRYISLIDKQSLQLFSNIDMALGSKVIFSESEQDIKKIEELSNEKELFDMNFYTVVDNTKTYLKGFLKGLFISLGILLIFMITLVFLGGNRLIMLIKKNKRDYLIKMCCGATYRSIRLTNIKLLTLVDILASIPTYIYIFIYNGNLFVFLTVFIVSVALNYIIIWRTFKKASVKNIYELMRRE